METSTNEDEILSRLKEFTDDNDSELTPAIRLIRKYYDQILELRRKGISWRKIALLLDKDIRYRTLSSAFDREEKRRRAAARKEASKNKDKKIKKDNKPELPRMGYAIRQEGKSVIGDRITKANEKSDDVVNQDLNAL